MEHELRTVPDSSTLAAAAAAWVAEQLTAAVAAAGSCAMAVSGGTTPWEMFAALRTLAVPWQAVDLYQVDERVAPAGDPARNLTHLQTALSGLPATVHPMPVEADDLAAAAADYAAALPERFALLHLGLGPDGHTASLVPGDPVLAVEDRLVAITQPYQGHRRMTLTFPALARAEQLLWLVAGADKQPALHRLLAGDRDIPAGRVVAARSTVFADRAAAGLPDGR